MAHIDSCTTPEIINSFRNLGFQNPFGTTYTLSVRPSITFPIPVLTVQNPLQNASPAVNFNTVLGIDPNFKDGYVGQWNLTAQYANAKHSARSSVSQLEEHAFVERDEFQSDQSVSCPSRRVSP